MEGAGASNQDLFHLSDCLENLLKEIPKATSGPCAGEPNGADPPPELPRTPVEELEKMSSPSSKFSSRYNSPWAPKNGGTTTFYGGLTRSESSSDQKFQRNGNVDNTVTRIMSDIRFPIHVDDLPGLGYTPPMAANLNSPNPQLEACPPFMRTNGFNEFIGNVDFRDNTFFPRLGEMSTNGFNEFSGNIDNRDNTFFPRFYDQEVRNTKPERLPSSFEELCQRFPIYSGAMPGYEQQYCLDGQSPTYISPQNLDQFEMEWRYMAEGRHCIMNQEYFYPQELQNEGSTAREILVGRNISIDGSAVQPYLEMPFHCKMGHGSQDSYLNVHYVHRRYSHSNLSHAAGCPCQNCSSKDCQSQTSADALTRSSKDFPGHRVFDTVGKQYLPEKSWTRSHGANTLRSLRSDSVTTNQSPTTLDNNGMAIHSGHLRHPIGMCNGFLHLDDKNSKSVRMTTVDDIVGRILSVAKDQNGCRFLQSKFTEGTPEDVRKIFAEIIGHVVELMTDPFGNYLVQKLVEVCSVEQRMQILRVVTRNAGELIRISCDTHGTRVVQKIIETLQTPEQFSMIVSSLKPGIVSLMMDINGNHVAQRCVQYLSSEYKEFLFDAAVAHCFKIATDRQGCCVLQKYISNSDDGEQKQKLMADICSKSLILSQDQYGNYVVQNLLDQKITWVMNAILDQLEGNYEHLSKQKCSSNVIEKCLKIVGGNERDKIIRELSSNPRLLQILQDPFGNYVIQSALRVCKGDIRADLVKAIVPHAAALRCNPYGRKVLSSIYKRFH